MTPNLWTGNSRKDAALASIHVHKGDFDNGSWRTYFGSKADDGSQPVCLAKTRVVVGNIQAGGWQSCIWESKHSDASRVWRKIDIILTEEGFPTVAFVNDTTYPRRAEKGYTLQAENASWWDRTGAGVCKNSLLKKARGWRA